MENESKTQQINFSELLQNEEFKVFFDNAVEKAVDNVLAKQSQEYEEDRYLNRIKSFTKDKLRDFVHDSNKTVNAVRENYTKIANKFTAAFDRTKESALKSARTVRNDAKIVSLQTKDFATDAKINSVATVAGAKEAAVVLTGPAIQYATKNAKVAGTTISERYSAMERWTKAKSLSSIKALSKAKDATKEYASRFSNSFTDSKKSLSEKISKESSAVWGKMRDAYNAGKEQSMTKQRDLAAQKTADRSLGR